MDYETMIGQSRHNAAIESEEMTMPNSLKSLLEAIRDNRGLNTIRKIAAEVESELSRAPIAEGGGDVAEHIRNLMTLGDVHTADGEWHGVCSCPAGEKIGNDTPQSSAPVLTNKDMFDLTYRRYMEERGHSYDPWDIAYAWNEYQNYPSSYAFLFSED